MTKRRGLWIELLVLSIIIAGFFCWSEIYRRRDYREDFIARKGRLVSARDSLLRVRPTDSLYRIVLENDRGLRVDGYLSIPSSGKGPYPALVILGGLGTGKRVLDYLEETEGLAMLAIDYPYRGKTRKLSWWEFLTKLPAMREAVINTVPAAMLCNDYLEGRNDVDPRKIVIAGGSLGALFVPAIAASDPRFSAAILLFGGGDLQSLFYANLNTPKPVSRIASWFLATLVSPVEPLKYADRISPRPLFMLNGTGDTRVPVRCTQLLYSRAKPPKTIVWIPSEHVHVSSAKFRERVLGELEAWLKKNQILSPGQASSTGSPLSTNPFSVGR